MARDNDILETATDAAPVEESTDTSTTEATPAEGTTEGTTEATPATEAAATPAAAPKIDVNAEVEAFMEAVNAPDGPIETADKVNANVSPEALAAIIAIYSELPSAAVKRAAQAAIGEAMVETLSEKFDSIRARAYSLVKKALESVTTPKQQQTAVVNPVEAFVDQATALYLGTTFLVTPKELPENWQSLVQAKGAKLAESDVPNYLAYLATHKAWVELSDADKALTKEVDGQTTFVNPEPVAPKVDPVVVRAAHLARGKATAAKAAKANKPAGERAPRAASGTVYDGPKRSITEHIREYFADKPVGTFAKIAEIRAFKSGQYPDGDASQGAISAALFADGAPKDVSAKLPGIVAVEVDSRKGARKDA